MWSISPAKLLLYILVILVIIFSVILIRQMAPGSPSGISGGSPNPKNPDEICLKKHFETIIRRMDFPGENLADKPIIQYYYADWCIWCEKMRPIWEKIKKRAEKDKKLSDFVFLEQNQDECNAPGISGIPKIVKYHRGKISIFHNEYDYDSVYNFILSG